METMEKIAALPASTQVGLMAESIEKLAAARDQLATENQKLASELEFEKLCTQVMDSGQNPWVSRTETLDGLKKLASEGRLDAFRVSLDLLPGTLPKLAAGLSSGTEVDDDGKRKPNVKESRARVFDAVMGGAVDD